MAKTIIKATFKNIDTLDGYVTNQEYTLAIEHNKIQRTTGSGIKQYATIQCFLKDWEKIKEVKK